MKAYLQFGDWSKDGHGKYHNVLVSIESMNDLYTAQQIIKVKYGKDFFEGWANHYGESWLSSDCWKALIDNNMPVYFLEAYDKYNDWSEFKGSTKNISIALKNNRCPTVSFEFIEQAFIWLLNQYGANIINLGSQENIPCINNWTCPGFENVGYGCFD